MSFGYFDFLPQNPFAPKRTLTLALLAAFAGGCCAQLLVPLPRPAWIVGYAVINGLTYALGAKWMQQHLRWIEGQEEAGWRQNLHSWRVKMTGCAMALCAVAALGKSRLGLGRPTLILIFCLLCLSAISIYMEGFAELERLLVRQRDLMNQARLAPHFLHGALSNLKACIQQDPLEAQALVDQLARLSREAIAITAEREIPLLRELAFVEAYLGVERARRGASFQAVIDVPEALETQTLPPMSLQLLVENALRYGLPAQGGELGITVARCPEGLRLCVEDPGQGEDVVPGLGQSLEILRRRLERASDLSLTRTAEGRHLATLLLRRP